MPAERFALSGLMVTADLEDLGVPIVVDVVGAGDFAELLLGFGGDAAQGFDVVAEEADLHRHADRRTGFELLDRDAGRGDRRRQLALQPPHHVLRSRG